jgi:protein phosphatase
MKISLYPPLFIHEIGKRNNQEDALWPIQATVDDRLFVLCDGMGGYEHGEIASQTVSQAIGNWYHARAVHPINKPQIEDALSYAYAQLDIKDDGKLRKMGTTLTLLYLGSEGVIAAHMGDSRIYHFRPDVGVLYQSRDHSLAYDLFQAGEITYDEMINFPQKNIVTRAMTPDVNNRMHLDITQITDVLPGDYFYMCSDGMLEQISNNELVSILSSGLPDEEKRQQLITATIQNQDNHSAWILHVKDVIKEEGDEQLINEETTSRFNAINIISQVMAEKENADDVVIVKRVEKSRSLLQRMKETVSIIMNKQ